MLADKRLVIQTEELSRALSLTRTMAHWLVKNGRHDVGQVASFLEPRLSSLTPPDAMADRDRACERLAAAIRRREVVVVYGDYDCDGITATAIMTELIRELGGHAIPMLASRFDGGYGLSERALCRIREHRPGLVVTCDCGSSDHERLQQLTASGVDVIVIDHHLVPETPLPVLAFLNPHRPECGFPYKHLASCGLALSMAAGLRRSLGVKLDVRKWLDLVAVGTIADVAPLSDDNRALVRAGLGVMARAERPGLRALWDVLGMQCGHTLCGRDVAFRIAPQINGPGRLGSPDLALELLLATDLEQARPLAERLVEVSNRRRELQEAMVSEALEEIEQQGYAKLPAIVIGRRGWNPGIVGIVAGRLCDRYQLPTMVIGFDGDVGRGSVRGPRGARLHDALCRIAPVLERFGGHQAAAGVEVRYERLDALRGAFCEAITEIEREAAPADAVDDDALLLKLDPADSADAVMRDFDRLEPCGEGNPRPKLVVDAHLLQAREVKGGHLKLRVDCGQGGTLNGFGIGLGAQVRELNGRVRLFGDLRRNHYQGNTSVELFVEKLECLRA